MIGNTPVRLARAIRRRIRPIRQRVASAKRPATPPEPTSAAPTVSIIVPIFAVERYLADCLDSLVAQAYGALQIIVVDDGSPDASFDIAQSYALRDERIELIRQSNRGLGAARNAGLAAVSGEYVTFVDSDDTIPSGSIADMVKTLQGSGSDFVVGTAQRFNSERFWTPAWAREVHNKNRFSLRLAEYPDILKDVFVCNKLFRTKFFREIVQPFPEGIRYEDQEPTARAYSAGTFDVLKAVVYNWRMRDDGSSITQQKSNPLDLADRLVVKKRVAEIFRKSATLDVYESWLAKALGFDLRSYYEQVPRTDEQYWNKLRDGVLSFSELITNDIWRMMPLADRLPALATVAGSRNDVARALVARDEYGWRYPGRIEASRVLLEESYLAGWEAPPDESLLEFSDLETKISSRITKIKWQGSVLDIWGTAYIPGIDMQTHESTLTFQAKSNRTGVGVPFEVHRYNDRLVDQNSNDAWNSYAPSGFHASLDTQGLTPHSLMAEDGDSWMIIVEVVCASVVRTANLNRRDPHGLTSTMPVAQSTATGRWVLGIDNDAGLSLNFKANLNVLVSDFEIRGNSVRLSVVDDRVSRLIFSSAGAEDLVCVPTSQNDIDSVAFSVRFPELPISARAAERVWTVRAALDGQLRRMTWIGSSEELGANSPTFERIVVACSRVGTLRFHQNDWWANVTDVNLSADRTRLKVSGRLSDPNLHDFRARLASDTRIIPSDLSVRHDEGTFKAIFHLEVESEWADRLSVENVGFSFRLAAIGQGGLLDERWIPVAEELQDRFPLDFDGLKNGLTLSRTRSAAALWVKFRLPYSEHERGRYAQHVLHSRYAGSLSRRGPREAVLFESFNGSQFTDSVMAIFQELQRRNLDLDFYWSVRDNSVDPPKGVQPLLIHSEAWIETLHSARYLVNNNNFPFYFRKRGFQKYIQVWHGTPLKRIGNDVPGASLSLTYRNLMIREAGYWDFLLAQNDFAAVALPSAFGSSCEVVNLGYPRNDNLSSPEIYGIRASVRRRLGIASEDCAVLYAPTWRDDSKTSTGRYSFVGHLDVEMARERLGANIRFLLRGHANTDVGRNGVMAGATDVTKYPEINELMLAADVLVTDYSSIMFDWCVTRKPIIFLAPDLEKYRDETRGFYLDLESIAPGPICRSTSEVSEWLENIDSLSSYADRYQRFIDEFAPRDDGNAAVRVVDHIWGQS